MRLGVDAGGTSCRARLLNEFDNVVGVGQAGPANTRLGIAPVLESIQAACDQAIHDAGLDFDSHTGIAICVGLAGFSRQNIVDDLRESPFLSSFLNTIIVSDAQIAHIGAHGCSDGGTVIVGTGSVGIVSDGDHFVQIGGRGFPASDLGSGAHIGLLALQYTLRASESNELTSQLTDELFQQFGTRPNSLQDEIGACDPTELAAFAPLVIRHAEAADSVARSIMQETALKIDRMLISVIELGAPALCLVGGLAPFTSKWLSPNVRERVSPPAGDPIDGAIMISKLCSGRNPVKPFRQAVDISEWRQAVADGAKT